MIILDRDVSAYHRYGLSCTVADCSWQGSEQDIGMGWIRSRAGVLGSAGLYLIHFSVPRYDGSCVCICLLTGLGSHQWRDCCPDWWDMLRCRPAEVPAERLQHWKLHDGSYSFGYSTLEMVKLIDFREDLPGTFIYIYIHCQKLNVSNLYHFDMALYPDLWHP
jgi:hypothetical protein